MRDFVSWSTPDLALGLSDAKTGEQLRIINQGSETSEAGEMVLEVWSLEELLDQVELWVPGLTPGAYIDVPIEAFQGEEDEPVEFVLDVPAWNDGNPHDNRIVDPRRVPGVPLDEMLDVPRILEALVWLTPTHGDDVMGPNHRSAPTFPAFPSEMVLFDDTAWHALHGHPAECAILTCPAGKTDPRCGMTPFCNPPEWQFAVQVERAVFARRRIYRDLDLVHYLERVPTALEDNFGQYDHLYAKPVLSPAEVAAYASERDAWLLHLGAGDRAVGVMAAAHAIRAAPASVQHLHQ